MQINGFSDFVARVASWGQVNGKRDGAPSGNTLADVGLSLGDKISFSDEGLRSLKQSRGAGGMRGLARHEEVESYLKSAYAKMEAMRNLAKRAQDGNLTDEDRLKLDVEMTNLQAELAQGTGKLKLTLDGRSLKGDAEKFDLFKQGVEKDRELAAAVLARGYERRMKGADGLYMDNGDGTSSVLSLWGDGLGHGDVEVNVYANSDVPKDNNNLESLRKRQNGFVKILAHDDFADQFAVLSLRSVDSANKAEKTLEEAVGKLFAMGEQLDAAYETIGDVIVGRAADPEYSRMGELDRIFKPIDSLWRISCLWDDGTAKYLII